MTPGAGTGVARPGVIQPVLPAEAPLPHVDRSTIVTSAPARARYQPAASPITPPPTTPTFIAGPPSRRRVRRIGDACL